MGTCNLDHSLQDVQKKLSDQAAYLPGDLVSKIRAALMDDADQEFLNEVFHLLKKYDLADEQEQADRNKKLKKIVS